MDFIQVAAQFGLFLESGLGAGRMFVTLVATFVRLADLSSKGKRALAVELIGSPVALVAGATFQGKFTLAGSFILVPLALVLVSTAVNLGAESMSHNLASVNSAIIELERHNTV